MEFKELSMLYGRCDPDEPVLADDDRNMDIDNVEIDGEAGRLRGRFAADLARTVCLTQMAGSMPAVRPEKKQAKVKLYVSGLRGSGKSTELLRLKSLLEDPDSGNFHVVLADAEELMDLTNPIHTIDILANLVHQTERSVRQLRNLDPDQALEDSYAVRLWNWLTKTEANLKSVTVPLPKGGKLLWEMKASPTLRQRVREIIDTDFQPFLQECRDHLLLLERDVRAQGKTGIVIILDSLEKLLGTSSTYDKVINSAEKVFFTCQAYLELPVHVLYTIPPALLWRGRFDEIHFLPMLKVKTRNGERYAPGMDVARRMVLKRLNDEQLSYLLGPQAVARLDRIIDYSAGFPREIIRLLQACVGGERHPLSERAFEKLFNEIDSAYQELVPVSAYGWLAKLVVEQKLELADESQRKQADAMFTHNVVLRYQNDSRWYDLHPAVKRIPGVQSALKALATETDHGSGGPS